MVDSIVFKLQNIFISDLLRLFLWVHLNSLFCHCVCVVHTAYYTSHELPPTSTRVLQYILTPSRIAFGLFITIWKNSRLYHVEWPSYNCVCTWILTLLINDQGINCKLNVTWWHDSYVWKNFNCGYECKDCFLTRILC